jgi:hypothetical protein
MVRHAAIALALVACGGTQVPSPPPPLPPAAPPLDAAVVDAPEVAVDDDIHDHGDDMEPALGCDEVVRDLASFPPVLGPDAPEREWSLAIRAHILEEDCEHDWSYDDRLCLHEKGPSACMAQLPKDMGTRLAKLGELAQKIADARAKPATIGCKHVVAAHYGAIRWQGRLDGFEPKLRNQMIAESRTLMQKACSAEQWSPSTRACLVLGGADLCFFTTNIRTMWGYPADGSVKTLGIPQCDEYDAVVAKFAACASLSNVQRDSIRRISAALKAQIAATPAAQRAAKVQGCEVGIETFTNMISNSGC